MDEKKLMVPVNRYQCFKSCHIAVHESFLWHFTCHCVKSQLVIVIVHYSDAIMGAMASEITSLTIVYSTVYSGADQRKHQSSALLVFVQKWPVTRKMFPFDDVIRDFKYDPSAGAKRRLLYQTTSCIVMSIVNDVTNLLFHVSLCSMIFDHNAHMMLIILQECNYLFMS